MTKWSAGPFFAPKLHVVTFAVYKKKKLPVGPALHYVTQTLFWVVMQNFLSQLT